MPQVTVTIAGKIYRMACGEGEEARLTGLAATLDQRIAELGASFGEIGELRLHVMAALMVEDDLDEARKRVAALEREVVALTDEIGAGYERAGAVEDQFAQAVTQAAERIERIAQKISPSAQPG